MKGIGIFLLVIGGIAAIWGFSYTSSHKLEGIGAMFGTTSSSYQLANVAGPLGLVAALVGLALLIVIMVKSSNTKA
jgi:hypothetical protein